MERLETIPYRQPVAELLEAAFTIYQRARPWLRVDDLSPKTVVRDMWERAMTFSEYVSYYGLARSEGTLLRYLSDAYRALRSGVPPAAHTDATGDIVTWLGTLVRQVDSSLLDEWEQLAAGTDTGATQGEIAVPGADTLTGNRRAFTIMIRNALFQRVELAALRRVDLLGELDGAAGWDAAAWDRALGDYFAEYDRIGTGPDARNPALLHLDTGSDTGDATGTGTWTARQVFDDPDGDHDWAITALVDLAASDEAGEPVIAVTAVGPPR
jgi:hypothetical protein